MMPRWMTTRGLPPEAHARTTTYGLPPEDHAPFRVHLTFMLELPTTRCELLLLDTRGRRGGPVTMPPLESFSSSFIKTYLGIHRYYQEHQKYSKQEFVNTFESLDSLAFALLSLYR
ncbi:unnamed protein product [Amoebophrya sp. A25]|nr:unnamed protein product [Amoebophrya sp. A25]|eukprot:GSA25T00025129001.1